jgi:hypothetical protein
MFDQPRQTPQESHGILTKETTPMKVEANFNAAGIEPAPEAEEVVEISRRIIDLVDVLSVHQ